MFLSKQFLVLPLLFITVASLYDDDGSNCSNDCDFKFDLNFASAKKGCFWITKNKKKASKRKETYCAKSEILNACEATCSSTCENDSSITFEDTWAKKEVNCAWISKNSNRFAFRKDKYCGTHGTDCVSACGRCSPNQRAESPVNVVFNFHTDSHPKQTSWALVDNTGAGTIIKSDGALYGDAFEANTLYPEAFALKRCVYYTLTVYDSYNDGLVATDDDYDYNYYYDDLYMGNTYTPGYFEVFVEGQRVMGSSDGVDFGTSDSVSIYVC